MKTMQINGSLTYEVQSILTPDAQTFLTALHREFESRRQQLLRARKDRAARLQRGETPDFLPETQSVRDGEWKVAPIPADLEDRRVEITGPAEPKMMINALNSGAKVFMADLEDALSPSWKNVIEGQLALQEAVRRTLTFTSPEGKAYVLKPQLATLLVRPRGWHLDEKHVSVDGVPMSGSLFDFGLYFFHNAVELLERRTGPYFYLPKTESHLEARLWNDVFLFAQDRLRIPRGTIRATVLIETILAAFEMVEILYELRPHIAALNAGRWDYIFSAIKKFADRSSTPIFPDRAQITMTVPFMRAYTELLVRACHKRGAHAIGGMSAFIPSRKDPEVNALALAKVSEDKQREARDGFDGTWVAHPDLVPVAIRAFDEAFARETSASSGKPHQKHRLRDDVRISAEQLITFDVPGGQVTEAGVRNNIDVAIQYIANWLRGLGAVAIHNLMEDAATAEISRAQLWQWLRRQARLSDGRTLTTDLYREFRQSELHKLEHQQSQAGLAATSASLPFAEAAAFLDQLVTAQEFPEFLTLGAYKLLEET